MFDPGAMGTVVIGLESVRNEARWTDEGTPIRSPKPSRLRASLARHLRNTADRLEPARDPLAGTALA